MNVTVDVNKVELNVQTNSASIEFEVHINKSTVVDQIQSDLSETDESKKSFVLGKDEFIAQIKEDLAREFSVTIERQDVVFEYGKVKILHDLNFNTQYKVVNPELIVNFGEGTKYLSPVLSYPSAETNTSSPFRGFYVIDADNILNEFSEFDYIKFSYDVVADTDVKYDCPVENLGNGVVFEESGFWHSRGGVATFNAVYPENTSEKFETVEDPLVWGSLTQAYTPKYCAIKGADLISYPYVAGATVDAVGSNPNILSVASHYSNNFERHDITPNETTFLKNTIAVGARLNNAGTDNTGATSYGYGVEFFEVANRPNLNEQYPGDVTIIDSDGVPHIYNGLGSAWWSYPASVQFAQSPTCAIIAAKFRKIKDATAASWALCREAARATASNNGVWDMYRGFGIVDPEAAILYIQNLDKTYLIDKIESENNKYGQLEYDDLKDNTPVPKKHVEEIKATIPVLPENIVIDANYNNFSAEEKALVATVPDKVDKLTGYSLVADSEILKIHSRNTDSTLLSENGQHSVYVDNSGVFHVKSISQVGTAYETHAEQVLTTKNEIILRDGAVAGLGVGEYVGFRAKLYDGVNDGNLVFDRDGWVRVGDVGSLQKLATIEETTTDGWLMKYNASTLRLEGFNLFGTANNFTALQDFSAGLKTDSTTKRNGSGLYALQDGGTIWHTTKWFTPTGTFTSVGTAVTTTGGQLTSAMVGAKIGVGEDKRVIIAFINSNQCTVDSSFSQDYSGVSFGVYARIRYYVNGDLFESSANGTVTYYTSSNGIVSCLNAAVTASKGLQIPKYGTIIWHRYDILGSYGGDIGLSRNAPGILEINNGTAGQYRDLILRDLTTSAGKLVYGDNDSAGTGYRTVRVPNS